MIYAPVVIPTLNRQAHLKRCLDSLAANTGAEHTEVYISVDFPPAPKYEPGYREMKAYLEQADFSRFKKVHVFYQEKNLGAGGNGDFLSDVVSEKYDRYIFTEDDNEFSPNFLEYINKGLEIFEGDDRVIGICAAKDAQWVTGGKNVLFAKLFPAYGFGAWVEKEKKLIEDCHRALLPNRVYGPGKMFTLMRRNLCLFQIYISGILCREDGLFWKAPDRLYICDSVRSLTMHLTDKVCVVPAVAKSRTWGNDGSGLNMPATDENPEEVFPIDGDTTFDYKDVDSLRFLEENYSIGDAYMQGQTKRSYSSVVFYIILLVCLGNRKRAAAWIQKIRKTLKKSG